MDYIVPVGACISISISALVARMPTISLLAWKARWEYDLATGYGVQRVDARKISRDHVRKVIARIGLAIAWTILSLILLFVCVGIYAASFTELSCVSNELAIYFQEKFTLVRRLDADVAHTNIGASLSPLADRLVTISLATPLGSLGIYLLSTTAALIRAFFFPVRWMKWPRHEWYMEEQFSGYAGWKNIFRRNRRRLRYLLTHKFPISNQDA